MSEQFGFMITVTTDNEWKVDVYSLDKVRKNIGGLMEVFHKFQLDGNNYDVICNESGLLQSLPDNMTGTILYGDLIVGNIVIVKVGFVDDEPDFVGMSINEIPKIKEYVLRECRHYIKLIEEKYNEP